MAALVHAKKSLIVIYYGIDKNYNTTKFIDFVDYHLNLTFLIGFE